MNRASNTRLRLTTQDGQAHAATGVLLDLGTNSQPHRPENAAENKPRALLTYTGQAGEHHRSDRSLLVKSGDFHKTAPTPVWPVQLTGQTGSSQKASKHQIGLPSSKLNQNRNSSNTGQQRTHPNVHPSKNPIGVCTSQTGERHRSDRCGLGSRDEQHPRVNSPESNSRSPEMLHGFAQGFGDSRNTS
jgi:hypothetical protein